MNWSDPPKKRSGIRGKIDAFWQIAKSFYVAAAIQAVCMFLFIIVLLLGLIFLGTGRF